MKISYFLWIFPCLFFSCNKDEEIIGDIIDPPSSLTYSVVEYIPAPGQFINDSAIGFSDIYSEDEACRKAEERLAYNRYVSLGGWGGYIVVKFLSSIENSGDYDFAIISNAFDTSNEPGIVWVMKDSNNNGKADDTWYELKGSLFGKDGYERNYWVKYSRPEPKGNTPWIDSNGETGFIEWVGNYHSQAYYYPDWIEEDSYTLYGSRLPLQVYQDPISGIWEYIPFDWGYADNIGSDFFETDHSNRFRISDAVSDDNLPVFLDAIDFIKVQTAVNGSAGWLGENSTEISGFYIIE